MSPRAGPHAGVLRRERRALLKAREDVLRDLGGLLVEMYRRGGFRDDLLAERAAEVIGIDARLAEIETLLARRPRAALRVRRAAPARIALLPELRPSGRRERGAPANDETIIEPAPSSDP